MAETQTVEGAPSPEEPAKPEKRRKPIIPALIFLAIIGGAAYLFVIRSKPEQAVRRLIDYQLKLSEAGVGEKLYDDTLSLQAKQKCKRDDFVGVIQQTPPDFWNLTRYKNLHIKVEGKRAFVTYVITYNGVVVDRATPEDPDIYSIATVTRFGDLITVAEQLQELAALNRPGVAFFASEKSYQDARKAVIKKGDYRRVLSKAGQWYDDYDSHSRCG
jgi:hypothetical protein